MTLYEINEQIARLYSIDEDTAVDTATGELFSKEAFDALKLTRAEKIDNTIAFYKNKLALANAIREEAKELTKRAKALEAEAERARAGLEYCLTQGEKFDSVRGAIRWRKSTQTVIDGPVDELPKEFLKITVAPKKDDIKKAILAGEAVPGAHVEDKVNMVVK